MSWEIIEDGAWPAEENMARDLALLTSGHTPLLRFHEWERPALTYGYFIDPRRWVKQGILDEGRRPTGGGITFHTVDLSFSIFVPTNHPLYSVNTLECYAGINQIVAKAVSRFLGVNQLSLLDTNTKGTPEFCAGQPTRYDLIFEGKKIGGAAQRRGKRGLLHQGNVFLFPLEPEFLDEVILDERANQSILKFGGALSHPEQESLKEARERMRSCLRYALNLIY